jgi:hypothetical protein
MKIIEARNVNDALRNGIYELLLNGVEEDSRNGKVLVAPWPVMTVYHKPCERVLFNPLRDANPYFHFMEALWMLAGRNDLDLPLMFNSRFAEFSDDGKTIHGAYGKRWRNWFGFDQLQKIIYELHKNPKSRRAVLSMWSPKGDLTEVLDLENNRTFGGLKSKDVPCNTHAYFDLRNNSLNMTVCNRSNDIIWGAYGANAVHFSILQEYIAGALNCKVGVYRQFSNNYHAYLDIYDRKKLQAIAESTVDMYEQGVQPFPLMSTGLSVWDRELAQFILRPSEEYAFNDDFFGYVALPILASFCDRKTKKNNGAEIADLIKAKDWQIAITQWIGRREKAN